MFQFFVAPIGTGSVLGRGICTQLICTHDMRSITEWVPKQSGKKWVRRMTREGYALKFVQEM